MQSFYGTRISEHLARTPEGYLIATAVPIARTGWQEYMPHEIGLEGDQPVQVWRDPAEVFSPETVASFQGKALCENHPPEFVSALNHSAYDKGHVQNIRRATLEDGTEALIADLLVTDPNLIHKIESGLREISCGYNCDYVPLPDKPGCYQQRNIRGNHVAVVADGRAGSEIRIRDERPAQLAGKKTTQEKRQPMSKANQNNSSLLGRMLKAFAATDAEPEEVANAAKLAAKAEERSEHNTDSEVHTEEPNNSPQGLGEHLAKAVDAFGEHVKKMCDAMEEHGKKLDEHAETLKGKAEQKPEGAADADLIPDPGEVGEGDKPENPVGDSNAMLQHLRALKPVIAASKDKKVIDTFNQVMAAVKSGAPVSGVNGYTAILNATKPQAVKDAEEEERLRRERAGLTAGAESPESRQKYFDDLRGMQGKNVVTIGRSN